MTTRQNWSPGSRICMVVFIVERTGPNRPWMARAKADHPQDRRCQHALPPCFLERFHPARFEWDGLAVLGNIFRFIRLPKVRSRVGQLFDCFYFTPKFFYFAANFYRMHFLTFF